MSHILPWQGRQLRSRVDHTVGPTCHWHASCAPGTLIRMVEEGLVANPPQVEPLRGFCATAWEAKALLSVEPHVIEARTLPLILVIDILLAGDKRQTPNRTVRIVPFLSRSFRHLKPLAINSHRRLVHTSNGFAARRSTSAAPFQRRQSFLSIDALQPYKAWQYVFDQPSRRSHEVSWGGFRIYTDVPNHQHHH